MRGRKYVNFTEEMLNRFLEYLQDEAVSYTHLDVYKRPVLQFAKV